MKCKIIEMEERWTCNIPYILVQGSKHLGLSHGRQEMSEVWTLKYGSFLICRLNYSFCLNKRVLVYNFIFASTNKSVNFLLCFSKGIINIFIFVFFRDILFSILNSKKKKRKVEKRAFHIFSVCLRYILIKLVI